MLGRAGGAAGRWLLTMIAITAQARTEDGFTLVELLVGIFMMLVTAAAAMALLTSTVRNEAPLRERSADIQKARTMVERVTRELRQGRTVSGATSSQLQILTYVNRASCGGDPATTVRLCRVTYTCSGSSCTRTEQDPNGGGTGSAAEVASGLISPAIFHYLPTESEAEFVGVTVGFPAQGGDDSVTVTDGVTLRNSFYPSG